ncbi:NmrA-like family domain-containing protein 1 [Chelonia mydas]|uniref:NmrA-like family domain-containing protein 1 n=1 Tax=Chelonia mydas TaxID=8469 RepID=M7BUI6_CHEMY|nr:NmrA-like family domain-containing protein 1 [Chelonia mydas]
MKELLLLSSTIGTGMSSVREPQLPSTQELAYMAWFYVMHPEHDMKQTLKLNPRARTFDQQLADNKDL